MANYYAVTFNFGAKPVPNARIEKLFNPLKDWLRFSVHSWLVYTDVPANEIRDMINKEFADDDPNVMVLRVDLSEWAVYAQEVTRNWLNRERDGTSPGR